MSMSISYEPRFLSSSSYLYFPLLVVPHVHSSHVHWVDKIWNRTITCSLVLEGAFLCQKANVNVGENDKSELP